MTDRRYCCCRRGCTICFDHFDRPNSDIILPFVEETGNWSIENGVLVEAGGNDGRAYCPRRHPIPTSTGVVWVTCKNLQIGSEPVLFLNHTPGTTPTEYLKLICGQRERCAVKLVSGLAESTWNEGTYFVGGSLVLKICRTNTGLIGGIVGESHPVWMCVPRDPFPTRRYAGVANHGTIPAYFDDFLFQEHKFTNPLCEECLCECDGICVPYLLLLTLVSDCPHRDGTQIQLKIDESVYPNFEWYGAAMIPDPLYPEHSSLNQFRLLCRNYNHNPDCDQDDFILTFQGFQDQCIGSQYEGKGCPDYLNCDPLDMRFGPFTCTGSPPPYPPPSCTETIIITTTA